MARARAGQFLELVLPSGCACVLWLSSTGLSPVFARIAPGTVDLAALALAMAAVFSLVPAGVCFALRRD